MELILALVVCVGGGYVMGRFLTKVALGIVTVLWLAFMLTIPSTSYESFGYFIVMLYWVAGFVSLAIAWVMQITEEGENILEKIGGVFFKNE